MKRLILLISFLSLIAMSSFAQETGPKCNNNLDDDGDGLAGVEIRHRIGRVGRRRHSREHRARDRAQELSQHIFPPSDRELRWVRSDLPTNYC